MDDSNEGKLSEQRIGKIAFTLLMAKYAGEGGFKVGPDLRRTLGQLSKDTGIPPEELEAFSKEVLVRMIGKAYGKGHVSLTMETIA
ncbi:hypothetical protein D4R49_01190 [bacterium]|nr:MAG: hypothetical protein D4R49_01190 [bacterium]